MSQAGIAEVQWSLGMGIAEGDLNDAQRFARALMLDALEAAAAQRDLSTSTVGLYGTEIRVKAPRAGVPLVGASARQVTNSAGAIAQWIGAPGEVALAGGAPQLAVYFLAADELLTTLAVGDATNPRIDRISLKLEFADEAASVRDLEEYSLGPVVGGVQTYLRNVSSQLASRKRLVAITKTVTAGTPAASPVAPALPAGNAYWCDVLVPANHNAVFTAATHFRDWRMPSRQGSCLVPHNAHAILSNWALSSGGYLASSGAGDLWAACAAPASAGRSRVISIGYKTGVGLGTPGSAGLYRIDRGGTPDTLTSIASLSNAAGLQETYAADLLATPLWDTGLPVSADSLPSGSRDRYQLLAVFTSAGGGQAHYFTRFATMGPG